MRLYRSNRYWVRVNSCATSASVVVELVLLRPPRLGCSWLRRARRPSGDEASSTPPDRASIAVPVDRLAANVRIVALWAQPRAIPVGECCAAANFTPYLGEERCDQEHARAG